jgi:hypothetical protein
LSGKIKSTAVSDALPFLQMELSLFRQRSLEALKQKARRGELFLTMATG